MQSIAAPIHAKSRTRLATPLANRGRIMPALSSAD
jgi:hypothetical protein